MISEMGGWEKSRWNSRKSMNNDVINKKIFTKKRRRGRRRNRRNRRNREGNGIARELLGWVAYLLIVIGLTYCIITFIGQRTRVSGHSMENSLHDGDNLIVDKVSYRFRSPKRFEIVVFPYKYKKDTYYIKRIIGLPGETVQVIEGYVYINGEKLDESYGLEEMRDPGIAEVPIQLGDDEYFVLGDNRNHSSDSRDSSVGVLKRKDLIGRAWFRIWPLKSIGVISHE